MLSHPFKDIRDTSKYKPLKQVSRVSADLYVCTYVCVYIRTQVLVYTEHQIRMYVLVYVSAMFFIRTFQY